MDGECSRKKGVFSFVSCGNAFLFNVGRKSLQLSLFILRNALVISNGVCTKHNIQLNRVKSGQLRKHTKNNNSNADQKSWKNKWNQLPLD